MKNFAVLFCILTTILSLSKAFAISENAPKWDNLIAPQEYANENLEYIQNTTVCSNKTWLCALGAISIVGIPAVIVSSSRSGQIERNNYWFKRKQEFETQRDLCDKINDNDKKMECFVKLRQTEQMKTLMQEEINLRKEELYELRNHNTADRQRYYNYRYYHNPRPRYYNSTITPVGDTLHVNTTAY